MDQPSVAPRTTWRPPLPSSASSSPCCTGLRPRTRPPTPTAACPSIERAERLVASLDELGDAVDRAAVTGLWSELVDTPPWPGPPVWLHGDLHPLNLLVHEGRLSAVIDFGDLTAGDPASDLAVAWMLLPPAARPVLRAAAGGSAPVDDDTWTRARGWAVALGVAMSNGDDRIAAIGRRTLAAALVDDA